MISLIQKYKKIKNQQQSPESLATLSYREDDVPGLKEALERARRKRKIKKNETGSNKQILRHDESCTQITEGAVIDTKGS